MELIRLFFLNVCNRSRATFSATLSVPSLNFILRFFLGFVRIGPFAIIVCRLLLNITFFFCYKVLSILLHKIKDFHRKVGDHSTAVTSWKKIVHQFFALVVKRRLRSSNPWRFQSWKKFLKFRLDVWICKICEQEKCLHFSTSHLMQKKVNKKWIYCC